MQYHSLKKTNLIVVAIFFLIIFSHYLGILNYPENKIRNLFTFALKSINDKRLTSVEQATSTLMMIDQLKAKNFLLEHENEDLRNQLNFKNKNNYNIVSAEIISKNLDTTDRVVILNKGTADGVKLDQPIIYGDGILVGKIIKVEDYISFARLLNDNQSKIGGSILNSDHSLGVVEGGFGLSIKMSFIPRNEKIMIGDQIITSGLEITTPRGFLIGKVSAIENESYQPFQQAVITPEVDYQKINIVGIVSLK